MSNPPPVDASRPPRPSRATGELKLRDVPKVRVVLWLLVAAVTLAGLILYFVYGDFVTPVLVMHERMTPDFLALPLFLA